MMQRILVANRGEIARRIFRTCRRLQIETVAVFSDFDRGEPHMVEADISFVLPGTTAAETYLNVEKLLDVAKASNADGVHPGYGFLSESPAFAEAVMGAGLVWIGPTPDSMRAMGSKITAKKIMVDSGVPILGGSDLTGLTPSQVQSAADSVGYPLLVKASAGGGGKGMRVVDDPGQVAEAVEGAAREALSAFGDGSIFLEKYLNAPHHIEIQILGDSHGEVISLFERECSIQRRHQKIIEESPSPNIDAEIREQMSRAAIAAGSAVGYVGAGTVEFLYQEGAFFFLEMNTRLQVEHPVTEMITELDLVELQIDIANGLPIPDHARQAVIGGHAVEARLYAEDPQNNLLPATGIVNKFYVPTSSSVRVDSGVESGSTISIHYDPLMAKIIAHGETRSDATNQLRQALMSARIHAPTNNRDLLVRILGDPEYLDGDIDTHFIDRRGLDFLGEPLASESDEALASRACALADQVLERDSAKVLKTLPTGWRNQRSQRQIRSYQGNRSKHQISYQVENETAMFDESFAVRVINLTATRVVFDNNGTVHEFEIARYGTVRYVDTDEWSTRLEVLSRFPTAQNMELTGSLRSPMPGKVIRIIGKPGDRVEEGDALVVLEAMKMEHTIRAPYAGTIDAIGFAEGQQVEAAAILVVVQPD
jgi:acyl-CoA carboxylase subunit alpha